MRIAGWMIDPTTAWLTTPHPQSSDAMSVKLPFVLICNYHKFHFLLECKMYILCACVAARLSHFLKARQRIFYTNNPSLTSFLYLFFSQVVVIWTSFSSASILSCVSSSQSFLFFLKFKKVIHFLFWANLQ